VSGTKSLALINRTAGNWTVTAADITDGTKSSYTSPSISVKAGALAKLQVLTPGETAAPGSPSGKIGTPIPQTAGIAFTVTVNSVDANWNLISTNDTVTVTSTDPNAALPANAALLAGTQTYTVTLKTAGSSTVAASDVTHVGVAANTSPAISVNPGAFAKLQVLAPGESASPGTTTGKTGAASAQTDGAAFNVTVNAVDANWNVVNSVGDTAAISSSDANASLPSNAALVSGTKPFSVLLKTSGSQTVTASDVTDNTRSPGTSSSITVGAAALAKLQLLVPGETAAPGTATGKTGTPITETAGAALSVTVNAVDANWNLISTNDTVILSSSDNNAVLPAATALVAGTRTFTSITFKTAGSQSLTVSDSTHPVGTSNTSPAITVIAGPFAKLQTLAPGESAVPGSPSGKSGSPIAQTAAVAFSVAINAVDANWNLVTSVADVAGITSSDANAVLPANAALISGTNSFSVTLLSSGSRTVTASDITDSTKTSNTSSAITVSSAAFTKLQLLVPGESAAAGTTTGKTGTPVAQNAGAAYNVTVNAVDANWNLVSSVSDTLSLTSSDPNAALPANTALASGTKSLSLTDRTAGSWTVTTTDITDGTKTGYTSPPITVNDGALAKLQLLVPGETAAPGTPTGKTGTPIAQTAGSAFTVTVNSVDANWNAIATNDTVAIASSDSNALLPSNASLVAGTKTFSVTLKTAGSATVTATDSTHAGVTANTSPGITVGPGAFARLQLLVPGETASPGSSAGKTGTPSSQSAFNGFFVTVNAVDANWNPVNSIADTVGLTSSDTTATLPANSALSAGTQSLLVFFNTNGSFTITSSDLTDGSKTASTSPPITAGPAQFTQATGGSAISADTAGGAFTSLSGPTYSENAAGQVGTGTIILTTPAGFIFDTNSPTPTVLSSKISGSGNVPVQGSVTAFTPSAITYTVTASSGNPSLLQWQNIRVRATAGTPLAIGNLSRSGTASVVGLSTNVNFGALREVAGAASQLAIRTQPSSAATAGVLFASQPVIEVRDQFGNLRSAANGSSDNSTVVSAARATGTGVLQGATNLTAVDGVVIYTNLAHLVANTITIQFSSGSLTGATSTAIAVSPAAASMLAFTTQPGNAAAGSAFGTQPVVVSQDAFGNNSVSGLPASLSVNLSLTAGNGPLLGTTTLDLGTSAGNGVVVFNNLEIDAAGNNKQLTASASGLSSALSSVFTVNPSAATILVILTQPPAAATAGVAFSPVPVIQLQDQFGNQVTTNNATVISVSRNLGSASSQGTTSVTVNAGLASFSNISYNTAETINLNFSSSGLSTVTSSNVTVNPAAANRLTILAQPSSTATAGVVFAQQPVIRVEDQFGNLRTGDSNTVVTASRNLGNGALQGITNVTASGGLVTFTTLSHNVANMINLKFASGSLSNAISANILVSPAAFAQLQVLAPGETNAPGTLAGKTGAPVAQTAGAAFNASLNAVDAFWNVVSNVSDTISLSSSDTNASLVSTVQLPPSGAASTNFSVTLKTAGSQTVTASDLTDNTKSPGTSSAISLNAAALAKLQLLVPGETAAPGTVTGKVGTPITETAGTTLSVTVNAVDANWNPVSTNDTVTISSSDANATLPSSSALVAGKLTFTNGITFKTAGSQTLTASDSTHPFVTSNASPAIAVIAGPFAKLQILAPGEAAAPGSGTGKTGSPTPQTAAVAFSVAVNAVDANWNLVTSATDVVGITSSDPNAVLPSNAALSAGTNSFSVTFKTSGSRTLTASDITDGTKTSSTSGTITVNTGPFAKLQLLVPGESAAPGTASGKTGTPITQNAGTGYNVTVNAVDANWNVVTSVSDTLSLTSSDPNAALPANTLLVSGTKTLSLTNRTAGSWTVTTADVSDGTKTGYTSPAITITAGALAKLQILVPGEAAAAGTGTGKTGTPTAQTAGTAFTVTVNSVDANWNLIGTNDTVAITSSDANASLPANAALLAGSKTYSVTLKTAGSATVTASDVTHAGVTANTSPALTVNPGAFAKLQVLAPGESASPGSTSGKTGAASTQTAGAAFNVTVNAVDANWNLVNSVGDTAAISSSDANASLPSNAALVSGTKSFSVTLKTAGSQTVTASDVTDNTKSSNTSSAMTVAAAALAKLQLLVPGETAAPGTPTGKTGTPITETAGAALSVTVNAVDSNWNTVSTNDTVVFTSSDTNAALPAGTALVAGTWTFNNVTFKTVGNWTLTASDSTHSFVTSNTSPVMAVIPGPFARLQILAPGESAVPGSPSGKTGTPTAQTAAVAFSVAVNAVDANWNLVTNATDVVGITSSDPNAVLPANSALSAGSKSFSVTFKASGSRTVTASDVSDGTKTSNTSSAITVNSGPFVKLQLLVPGETAVAGSTTGKTGTPVTQNASSGYNVTVNAVDANWNIVTTITDTVGITSTDPNDVEPANTPLASGTKSLTLTNRTAGNWTVTSTDITDGTKTSYTSPSVTVIAGPFAKLQILVPGESAAPGSGTGKTGTPIAKTAGTAFTVTVNSVDANWNPISTNDTVSITSSDANAALPANAVLVAGTQTYSVTLKAAGSSTVTASDATHAGITANTSAAIAVNAGAFAKLQLLVPGESASPGSATGMTGAPSAQTAGTAFNVTVNAVDANWNLIATNDSISITCTDTNAALPANSALSAGTQNFSVTFKTAGSATVTASNLTHTAITASTSSAITINAGTFTKLQILVPGESAVAGSASGKTGTPNGQTGCTPFNVTVNAVDASWNLSSTITDTIGLTSTDTNAIVPSNTALVAGTKTLSVTLTSGTNITVTAADITNGAKTPSTSAGIALGTSGARTLGLQTSPPGTATAGVIFAPQPAIRVQDCVGNLVASDNGRVITAARLTGTGSLQGTTTATTVNGIATFTNLSYNVAETITINFTAAGLTNVTSGNIVVSAANANHLVFTTQPGGAVSYTGSALKQQPVVKALDSFGNVSSGGIVPGQNVTLTLTTGPGTLLGTTALDISSSGGNGSVTFTNVQCSDAGTNNQITAASSGLTNAVSSLFWVGGVNRAIGGTAISSNNAGAAYVNLTGPSYIEANTGDVGTGTTILKAPAGFVFDTNTPQPTVRIDLLGGSGNHNINQVSAGSTVAISSMTTTSITFSVTASTSGGCTNSLTWQNIRVRPTAGSPLASGNIVDTGTAGITAVTNNNTSFGSLVEVGPALLGIQTQPSAVATAGVPFSQQPVIAILDSSNNVITSDNSVVVTATRSTGSGTLQGTVTAKAVAGFAAFTNLSYNVAETLTISFTSGSLASTTSTAIAVSPAAATRLVFTAQPGGGLIGSLLTNQPVVQSIDQFGNNSTVGFGASKSLTVALTSGTGPLVGTTNLDIGTNAGNGLATFTNLEIDSAGTNKQLTASATGLSNAVSSIFAVAEKNQTISFGALANHTYGDAPFTVSATASSGLPVSFSILSGPATISGNTVTITGAGTVTVQATQPGNATWNPAPPVNQGFNVAKAALTVTADSKTRSYGAANPALTASYTGFVNGDSSSVLSGGPSLSTSATTNSAVAGSPYTISVTNGTLSAANYSFVFVNGSLSVTKAALNVTANNKTRTYGAQNPVLTVSYTGFVNGETTNVLSGSPALSTGADTNSAVAGSPYTITVAQGTLAAANYSFNFIAGSLSVTPAGLTVAAANQTRAYGATNPLFTVSYSGFVNAETTNVLSGSPAITTTATTNSSVAGSPYPITPTNGTLSAANYSFTFVNGQLTITQAVLTVTADNKNKSYGSPVPALTASYTGFVNGQTTNVLSGAPALTTTATTNSPSGSYPITIAQGTLTASNYSFSFVSGTLSIGHATLTVTANNATRAYGTANPTFTVSYTGFLDGDTASVLYGAPALSTTGGLHSTVAGSPYTITVTNGSLSASNYDFSFVNGQLTVTQAVLTVTATAVNKVYDRTTVATVSLSDNRLSGDNLTLSYASASFADKAVAIGKTVTVNGISVSGPDSANYAFNTTATTTASITAASLTASITANNKAYDGTTAAVIATRSLSGVIGSDVVSLIGGTAVFSDPNVGNGKQVTATGLTLSGADALNYTANTSASTTANITPALLTVTADNKTRPYGTTNPVFTASYSGFIGGENTNLLSGAPSFSTSADTNSPVGTYPITVTTGTLSASNYSFSFVSGTLTVTRAVLTVTAINTTRAYGTTNPVFTAAYSGFLDGDDTNVLSGAPSLSSTAGIHSSVAGNPYTITVTNGTLSSTNYSFVFVNGQLIVTQAVLTVTAAGVSRTYDGTTAASVTLSDNRVPGDNLTTSYTNAAFADKNVGAAKPVSVTGMSISGPDAANYLLASTSASASADITARALTISATGINKVYDRTTAATVSLSDNRLSGDNLTINYASASFADKTVASGKTVTVNSISVTGPDSGNYTFNTTATTTAGITAASLTASITANNKAYDGTTTAIIATRNLSGVIGSDDVSLVGGTATFADSNVGNGKVVSAIGLSLSGADAANYTANTSATTTANITPALLTVTADDKNRPYAATNPVFTASYSGFIGGENTNLLSGAPSFSTSADTNSPIGAYPIAVTTGTLSASNYSFSFVDGTLTVTKAVLTVTANNATRAYGTTNPVFSASYSGFLDGDDTNVLTGAPSLSSTADIHSSVAGSPYTVVATNGTLSASNYSLAFVNGQLTITQAVLTVTATGVSKTYDGTTAASVTLSDNRVPGDNLTTSYTNAAFADKNVGTAKPVSVSGISLAGADASNYSLASTSASATADITARALTISATGVDKVYDGTVNATVTLSDDRLNGDVLTENYLNAAFADKNVGTAKPVSVSGILLTGTDARNYTYNSSASASANISAAALTVTANDQSRAYGITNSPLTAHYTGFASGDDQGVISGNPDLSTTADASSPPGTYPISVAPGSLSATNYSFSFVNGTLTVTRSAASVALSSSVNPSVIGSNVTFTASITGASNGPPSGLVQFRVNGAGAGGLVTLSNGIATFDTTSLAAGTNYVTAEYQGDTYFAAGTNSLNPPQVVQGLRATITLGTLANHSVAISLDKLLFNDSGPANDSLSVTGVSATSTNGGSVVLSTNAVIYTPATNFSGLDLFSYTVSDDLSDTTGYVLVTVAPATGQAPNQIGNIVVATDGVHVRFAGIPGITYTIERSTDTITWSAIATIVMPNNGFLDFTDTNPPAGPVFYRTSTQ
jgi:hypothetical protein